MRQRTEPQEKEKKRQKVIIESHKEMTHVLGLQKNPFLSNIENTGWYIEDTAPSTKKRYDHFKENPNSNLNFDLLPASFSADALQKITNLPPNGYVGFSCRWPRHAFTLNAVKEGNQTHFIYVNRGKRHFDLETGQDKNDAPTVMVFSVENQHARSFAKLMLGAAMTPDPRKGMSQFLERHKKQFNEELSELMEKKNQKTGNCSIANSNIAWHFQLAAEEMQKSNKSFAQAYEDTEQKYREMRIKDRVQAFKYLLNDRGCYISDNAFLYNYFQAIEKFARKDIKVQGQHTIEHIKTLLEELDPKGLSKLVEPLINDNFTIKVDEYIDARIQQLKEEHPNLSEQYCKDFAAMTRDGLQSAKTRVLMHAFNRLSPGEQMKLIAKDISLLCYADQQLQLNLLKQDYNKYALYADKELNKRFPEHPLNRFRKEHAKELDSVGDSMKEMIETVMEGKEEEYLRKSKIITTERKTKDAGFFSQDAAQKEVVINNTLKTLYSSLWTEDKKHTAKTFEELCRVCCERRFYLGGDKYSVHTESAKWLINRICANDEIGEDFRKFLKVQDVKAEKLTSTVTNMIQNTLSGKNTTFNSYKERYTQQIETSMPLEPTQKSLSCQ
ncbi:MULTISPECIES: hypothetical protein [Legionella]|uniref:hypothetical protein n=1 Tax=Legionella TaxID=445 RepID=UPI00096132D4|nr:MULTISPECIES: hypothetical protein [Legionella]MBN9228272.1 hypothetical protein [Legionella steelei]OJW09520.1 MAG: hypothetical protein BGO44_04380 [Legionella sp. 39-23]